MKCSEVFSKTIAKIARLMCGLFILIAVALSAPVTAQINVNADVALPVDANPNNPGGGSGTIINVAPNVEISGIPGIVRTSGTQALTVNFESGANILNAGTGILVGTDLDSFTVNGGTITTVNEGIILTVPGISVSGNFTNSASVGSSGSSAIVVNGMVGGTFANTGALTGSSTIGRGISIGNTVGSGFSNTGNIGTGTAPGDRVGLQGIFVAGEITGNFLNEGDVFSTQSGVLLNESGTSVSGNFTNTGTIDSANMTAIEINGAVGGLFTNSGSLLAPSGRGISVVTTVGNGFVNSGDIGTSLASGDRAGLQGIFVGGQLTGNFQNSGDIFSTLNGILLNQAATSLTGNFTNTGNVTSATQAAILINGGVGGSVTNSGQIGLGTAPGQRAGQQGLLVVGQIAGDLLNDGDIFSTQSGIDLGEAGTSILGNFTNNATIDSSNNNAISINGAVGGSFTNTGDLSASSSSGRGISITTTVGDGFTNSGDIGSSLSAVGQQGIFIGGLVTDDFLNEGNIFSTQNGILLNQGGTSLTGSFTNTGDVMSSDETALSINGIVSGSFTNSGQLGIGSGVGERLGEQGIFVRGHVAVDFLNDGNIFSTQSGILLGEAGTSILGDFTNNGDIDSQNSTALVISGAVGGSFTNTGSLLAPSGRGISIATTVGDGFTNSGSIGTSLAAGDRVAQEGIYIGGQLTGDFLNEGDIFSTLNGILLNQAGSSLTGSFTNSGNVTSLTDAAILLNGGVDGSFTSTGQIGVSAAAGERAGEQGIIITGQVGVDFLNEGDIFSTQSGIELAQSGLSIVGDFTNTGAIDSLDNNAITINGAVGGSFTNTGSLLAPSARGISILTTVGDGFTNSGDIGTSLAVGDRVSQEGIFIGGLVTGDFQNDGDIFSNLNGIRLNQGVTSLTGDFTNTGNVTSASEVAILLLGAMDGSFTSTGQIGVGDAPSERTGSQGIYITGEVGGNLLNEGDIFSTESGIELAQNGTSIQGDFTNSGTIDSLNNNAITIRSAVGGSFTNTGTLLAPSARGIWIGTTVGDGFTNTGDIGTSLAVGDRVAQEGIYIVGQLTGDFQNDGDIFSNLNGILLNQGGTSVTGSFTNTGTVTSSSQASIFLNGGVGGSFTNSGQIGLGTAVGQRAGLQGLLVAGQINGDFQNDGDIFSTENGIELGADLSGNFTNTASIDSSDDSAIVITGSVGSSFLNEGVLSASSSSGRGISISSTVGNGFTNSGDIGADSARIGLQGIYVGGQVTGNFLNEGEIFSNQSGIHLNAGTSVTGSFTNSGAIDSSSNSAILVNGTIGNGFINSGDLLASSNRGISIVGAVTNGFTNSGQIGADGDQVGQQGIFVGGQVVGNFLNQGDITSSQDGIRLNVGGVSVTGNFTNTGNIDSSNSAAISITAGVGGSFTNTGSLLAATDRGISIGTTVGNGFTNSGDIGTGSNRVDDQGIFVGGQITGNFLNTGAIFSDDMSIFLNESGVTLDGDFTNTADLYSAFDTTIFINGEIDGSLTNSGQIGTGPGGRVGGRGIYVEGRITGDFLNDTGGNIFSSQTGIQLGDAGTSIDGNFTNNATIDAQSGSAILINGTVGGSFNNTGALLAPNERGISIAGSANSGFTNSGQIGASSDRVGQQGIFIGNQVTGNFLNQGAIYSTQSGIQLNDAGLGVTGNFTNSGDVDSSSSNAINILGDIVGSFSNSGALEAPSALSRGISITGTIGNGFTSSGQIGGASRIGDQGIFVSDLITGTFLNSSTGVINSEGIGVLLIGGLNGTFTNSGTIDSLNDDGVQIFLPTSANIINAFGGTITGGGGRSIEIVGSGSAFTNAGTLNGDVMLGVVSSGDATVPGVVNDVTLTDTGVINGKIDIGVNTNTSVTLNGTGTGRLSTAVMGGIYSGPTANQIDGSLIKNGSGQWTIDQDITVVTGADVLGGTLRVGNGTTLTSTGGTTINGGTLGSEGPSAEHSGDVTLNSGILTASGTFQITGDLTWNGGNISSILGTSTGLIDLDGSLIIPAPPGDFELLNDATFLSNTDYLLLASTNTLGGFDPANDFTGNDLFGLTPEFKIISDQIFVTFNGDLVAGGNLLQNSAPVSTPFAAEFLVDGAVQTGTTSESNTIRALSFQPGGSLQVFNTLQVTDGIFTVDNGAGTINGGLISVPNDMTKIGGGNLTVNSNVNVSGMTTITQGGLFLNGSANSNGGFNVSPSGTLGGNGLLTGDVVNDGTVAPGNSIGTLTVDGTYTQTSAGTLSMEIQNPSVRDLLIVTGRAFLGGTLALRPQSAGPVFGDVIELVRANGGLNGGFGRINGEPNGFRVRPWITNGNTRYNLIFAPLSYTQVAQGNNQTALAAALDQWIGVSDPAISNATLQLDLLRADEYPQVFEAILPSASMTVVPSAFSDAYSDGRTVSNQAVSLRSAPPSVSEETETDSPKRRIWADARGSYSSFDPNSLDSEGGTFLAGVDFRNSDATDIGFYIGAQSRESRNEPSDFESDGLRLGIYAAHALSENAYVVAVLGGGSSEATVEGSKPFGASTNASIDFSDFFGRVEGGYRLLADGFLITPFVGSQYTMVDLDGFTEESDSVFALKVSDGSGDRVEGYAGVEISRPWLANEHVEVTPYGRLTLRHTLQEDNPSGSATLNRGAGPSFAYTSTVPDGDGIEYGAGLRIVGKESSVSLVLGYTGFSASDYETHQGNIGVSFDL